MQRQRITPNTLKEWKKKEYCNHKKWERKKIRLGCGVREDVKKNNGYENGKKIKMSTLRVHDDKDGSVSVERSIRLLNVVPNNQLEIISTLTIATQTQDILM